MEVESVLTARRKINNAIWNRTDMKGARHNY